VLHPAIPAKRSFKGTEEENRPDILKEFQDAVNEALRD
jgi:hypothetical protein